MSVQKNHRKPTVLHVATINHSIQPDLSYAPIETVIHNIDKGLHASGHRSIVACSADSRVSGEHCVTVEKSLGGYCSDSTQSCQRTMNAHHAGALGRAKMGDIDVIHVHDADAVDFLYDNALKMRVPIVMTLHVSAQESYLGGDYQRWSHPLLKSPLVYFAAISEYQKRQYHDLVNTKKVVYHGINVEEYPAKENPDKGSYLFSIGRVTRDKGQDKAIALAKRTGSRLVIAGCVQNKAADRKFFAGLKHSIDLSVEAGRHPVTDDYHDRVIKPLLDSNKQIIYIGEISSEQKKHWYRHARATLFPIQWGEPFGLVMIESMACGTPVIAFNKGSVPEIIVNGKTGFVVESMSDMVKAVGRIDDIDPRECRSHVRKNFSIEKMALSYSELYLRIIDSRKTSFTTGRFSADYVPALSPVGMSAA